jgi:hypothetical protein
VTATAALVSPEKLLLLFLLAAAGGKKDFATTLMIGWQRKDDFSPPVLQ